MLKDALIEELLGIVGGKIAYYAVGGSKLKDCRNGRGRFLPRSDGIHDRTNYLADGLCPSVFVEGSNLGTSTGCLLQWDTTQRLTVVNHGFDESEINVYHPQYNTNIIATFNERWRNLYTALCQVQTNVDLSNANYFEAPPP